MKSTRSVKICGLTSEDAVDAAIDAGAAFLGFVFFERSPRHLTYERAKALVAHAHRRQAKTVAVIVNPTHEEIEEMLSCIPFDVLQLHGHESVARVQEIRASFPNIALIKAISVRHSDDIAAAMAYEPVVDYLLFDAKAPDTMLPGGNGLAFEWKLLAERSFSVPWFLAGGIHSDNVQQAISASGAKMIDVSSCVESSPGVKDVNLIKQFMEATNVL